MGKATQKVKSEFCNVEALDIFIECLTQGSIKLNGKQCAITSLNNDASSDIDRDDLYFMLSNPSFYSFDFSKYDEHYNALVINHILSKNPQWIKENYIDVLVNFHKNRRGGTFTLTAVDDTKSVCINISPIDIYHYVTQLIANKIKAKFIEILDGDIYSEFVQNINPRSIELLYRLTNGEFINKSYAKDFIKIYMSIISLRTDTKIIETYSHYGIACTIDVDVDGPHLINSSINYKDEKLFFRISKTGEIIAISFANNKIEFILNESLFPSTKRDIEKLADRNYISQLFTSGECNIFFKKVVRDAPMNSFFMFNAIHTLLEDYFLFITVKNGWCTHQYNTGDVILVDSPGDCDHNENAIMNIRTDNIGDVVHMSAKEYLTRSENFSADRNITNECPIPTDDLNKLLEKNYISVVLTDGSRAWVSDYSDDRDYYEEPIDDISICLMFGDGTFEWISSFNIKEIEFIQPRNISVEK